MQYQVFFKDLVNIKDENILKIHNVIGGDTAFSIRSSDGKIRTIYYSDIRDTLDHENNYQVRLNLAKYELEYFDTLCEEARKRDFGRTVMTPDRIAELKKEIKICTSEINKYKKVRDYFDQKVQAFRAGVISSSNESIIKFKDKIPSILKELEAVADSYIYVCEEQNIVRPTISMLKEKTDISGQRISKIMMTDQFRLLLVKKIKRKLNYAKNEDKKSLFIRIFQDLQDLIDHSSKRKRSNKEELIENMDIFSSHE